VVDDDPGWGFSSRLLLMLVPGVGIVFRRRRARSATVDGLVLTRQLFTTFCLSVIGFGVVIEALYLTSEPLRHPATGVAIGLLSAGGLSALFGQRIERPLDCTDAARLAGSYRTRFFLRIAFSEVAALFAFVGFFLTYHWWVYPVGAVIALLGFARGAPTASHLRDDQHTLVASGCSLSLVGALRRASLPGGGAAGSDGD
jgi:hypothetical protein